MESRLGMPSRTLLLEAGRMVGRRNDRVRGIDQSGECITTGQRLGEPSWFGALVELLFNDPEVTRSKRTRRRATCERSDATRKRGLRQGTVTPDGPAVYMGSNTPGIRANTQCCLTLPSRGTSKGWRLGRPSCQTLNIMREAVIAEVSTQLSEVVGVIERHRTDVAGRTFVRLRSGWRPEATQ